MLLVKATKNLITVTRQEHRVLSLLHRVSRKFLGKLRRREKNRLKTLCRIHSPVTREFRVTIPPPPPPPPPPLPLSLSLSLSLSQLFDLRAPFDLAVKWKLDSQVAKESQGPQSICPQISRFFKLLVRSQARRERIELIRGLSEPKVFYETRPT